MTAELTEMIEELERLTTRQPSAPWAFSRGFYRPSSGDWFPPAVTFQNEIGDDEGLVEAQATRLTGSVTREEVCEWVAAARNALPALLALARLAVEARGSHQKVDWIAWDRRFDALAEAAGKEGK